MELYKGDCLEVMRGMEANSIDAIITDPPYGLEFMGKEWDGPKAWRDDANRRDKKRDREIELGYGKKIYGSVDERCPAFYNLSKKHLREYQGWCNSWAVEVLRVAKPGCHLLAFGGTRTFHRLACAIEDAGWEIRDFLMWIYGSGFPKSHDVSKAIDKKMAAKRKKGFRPIAYPDSDCWGIPNNNKALGKTMFQNGQREMKAGMAETSFPATDAARQWNGWGTALKPAWEPIILARKPLDGTVAENIQKWGTGAINVDGCRVGIRTENESRWSKTGSKASENRAMSGANYDRPPKDEIGKGRWPANLIHDGSEEVLGLFPETKSGASHRRPHGYCGDDGNKFKVKAQEWPINYPGDSGSAARFFYCAKASRAEREMGLEGMEVKQTVGGGGMNNTPDDVCGKYGSIKAPPRNHHPTVKPLALMRYFCRLITPPNGLILDPFMGSGTTGMAAKAEGFRFIGIELDGDYHKIAEKRIAYIERIYQPQLGI